jgi:hypothetical protein
MVVSGKRGGEAFVVAPRGVSTWVESLETACPQVEVRPSEESVLPVAVVVLGGTRRVAPDSLSAADLVPDLDVDLDADPDPVLEEDGETGLAADRDERRSDPLGHETILPFDLDDPPLPTEAKVLPIGDAGSPASPSARDEIDLSHLFETRHVGVEAAAMRELVTDEPGVAGLIAGIPGQVPAAPASGDHDGMTISPADLAALRVELRNGVAPAAHGPASEVHAVRCEAGHLNPPHADRCRTCRGPIHDRSVVSVPRPSLGVLEFDDGRRVEVDRPLLIGRRPSADPQARAGGAGEIVIEDPDGSISRVHLELRLEGWEVLIVDRSSTNGTFVEIPGQPPNLLRPLEPCVIADGTLVRLAEVTSFTFRTGAS